MTILATLPRHAATGATGATVPASIPPAAIVAAAARSADVRLWRHGDLWFIQCCGLTAPIPAEQSDAWRSLVCDVSCGHMRPASLARCIGLLPGAADASQMPGAA